MLKLLNIDGAALSRLPLGTWAQSSNAADTACLWKARFDTEIFRSEPSMFLEASLKVQSQRFLYKVYSLAAALDCPHSS